MANSPQQKFRYTLRIKSDVGGPEPEFGQYSFESYNTEMFFFVRLAFLVPETFSVLSPFVITDIQRIDRDNLRRDLNYIEIGNYNTGTNDFNSINLTDVFIQFINSIVNSSINTEFRNNFRAYLNYLNDNNLKIILEKKGILEGQLGGKKSKKTALSSSSYTRTSEKVRVNGNTRTVYTGKRGGKFIRMNEKYVSLRKALKKS